MNTFFVEPDWLMSYRDRLKNELALSQSTQVEYVSRARQFYRYICTNEKPHASLGERAKEYIIYLRERKVSAHTINGMITVLEQILEMMREETKFVTERSRVTRVFNGTCLSHEETARVLNAALKSSWARDPIILFLMLRAGLSLNECRYLKLTDIHADGSEFVVHARNRSRKVQIDKETQVAMKAWLESDERKSCNSEYVFPAPAGGPLTRGALDNQVRRLGWQSGIVLSSRTLQRTHTLQPAHGIDKYDSYVPGLSIHHELLFQQYRGS